MQDLNFLQDALDEDFFNGRRRPCLVIVEDDRLFALSVKKFLEKNLDVDIKYYSKPSECLELLALDADCPFCLLTDISFDSASADGLTLIDLLHERFSNFVTIAMTGYASIETAIMATKKGVFHYLAKPFELDSRVELLQRAYVEKLGMEAGQLLKKQESAVGTIFRKKFEIETPDHSDMYEGMIGRSSAMKEVFSLIERVANSSSTVLINGPSGTGKELVAKALHSLSNRSKQRLVTVNCGAIPAGLLESELFGHAKGSFTGAIGDRKGKFEQADGGTFFLDEIGDMPLLLQVKLLRVLQEKKVERVGENLPRDINVRIITATHRDIEKSVQEGSFREDLFYRLNVIPIKIPSLVERREDIPLLISYFLSKFVSADGSNKISFDEKALEVLMTHRWPGNVRELENLIERLVILKGGSIVTENDLPSKLMENRPTSYIQDGLINLPEDGVHFKKFMDEIEESLILQALARTKGNKNQASKLLSMNRTTLIEKMRKKGLN